MMTILRSVLKPIIVRFSVFVFCFKEYKYLIRHLCTSNTYGKREKLRYSLLLQAHIIEKGLSLKDIKLGFGVPKILRLLSDLNEYQKKYSDQEMLFFVLSIVEQYIAYHNSQDYAVDKKVLEGFESLRCELLPESRERYQKYTGGAVELDRSEFLNNSFPYDSFVKTRHSVRTFTGEQVPKSLIYKALEIAETTPSACNRQPWDIYVRTQKEDVIRLLDIQSGARQFKDNVSALIVVGSTANAFSITEGHQPYVNGGLYAMNLMLAFHSLNIGCIPLNLGLDARKLEQIKETVQMPPETIPVLLLAIGMVPDSVRVACSKRFSYREYTHFD